MEITIFDYSGSVRLKYEGEEEKQAIIGALSVLGVEINQPKYNR